MTNEEMVQHIQAGENKREYLEMLYEQNRGMIYKTIKKYKIVEPEEDLMQEGFIGLQKAAELFDQHEGVLFATFATIVIDHVVKRYINLCGSVIRIPEYKGRTFSQYKAIAERFRQELHREPTQEEVFCILGLRRAEAENLKQAIMARKPRSLSEPIGEDGDGLTLGDSIEDPENNIEELLEEMEREDLRRALWEEVNALGDPQAGVIKARFREGKSLEACGKDLDCRKEKVRQIQMKALNTLRSAPVKNRLSHYIDAEIYGAGIKGTGLTSYLRDGSSVERVALSLLSSAYRGK